MNEPTIRTVTVHWGGGGKVQLEEYGKQSSEYGCNVSRTYELPEDYTAEQLALFELETIQDIKDQLEPILQEEHDNRMAAREALS